MQYLEFENEIEPLEKEIQTLRNAETHESTQQVMETINAKQKQINKLLTSVYKKLDGWQTCQVARHPQRPHTIDYIDLLFENFNELHGDRMYKDDKAIIGGMGRLNGDPVMVLGHEKGRETDERIKRNWGMPHPEGYRKALRLMQLAENFKLPIITFIDTPGAFCGIGSEERGISQAIGLNLMTLATLKTPIVSVVIGEGGSGGALALGVGDELLMLENSVYSVISPEGCAAILWRDGSNGNIAKAANAMKMRAKDLDKLNLIDGVIQEPIGGAHRDWEKAAKYVKVALQSSLDKLNNLSIHDCIKKRNDRIREYGKFSETSF